MSSSIVPSSLEGNHLLLYLRNLTFNFCWIELTYFSPNYSFVVSLSQTQATLSYLYPSIPLQENFQYIAQVIRSKASSSCPSFTIASLMLDVIVDKIVTAF